VKPKKLTDLLRIVLRDTAGESEKTIKDECRKRCLASNDLVSALFDYWFENSRRDLVIQTYAPNSTAVLGAKTKTKHKTGPVKNHAVEVKEIKERMVSRLLDTTLSSGTTLRAATFKECEREGRWFSAVGALGKPNQIVGAHLTERDLCNVRLRYFANLKAVA
jgi:hypothetical protein